MGKVVQLRQELSGEEQVLTDTVANIFEQNEAFVAYGYHVVPCSGHIELNTVSGTQFTYTGEVVDLGVWWQENMATVLAELNLSLENDEQLLKLLLGSLGYLLGMSRVNAAKGNGPFAFEVTFLLQADASVLVVYDAPIYESSGVRVVRFSRVVLGEVKV